MRSTLGSRSSSSPVFALANAGVAIGDDIGSTLTSPTTLGIILGLFFGKQLGIVALAWLATRTGIAVMPAGVTWRQIWGVALLCGIGFTMSLFIAGLAFADPALLGASKVGILAGSLLSGIAGALVLIRPGPVPDDGTPTAQGPPLSSRSGSMAGGAATTGVITGNPSGTVNRLLYKYVTSW